MKMFGKILTAMVTPFDNDLHINWNGTRELVEHLVRTGTDTLVVAGTTGEGPTLTSQEKMELFLFVKKCLKELNREDVKLIANAGTNNTAESIQFVEHITYLGVADGLMLVNPYYNKPTQEGLYRHFSAIAARTHLPIMLYNIPGRTSVNLLPQTAVALSKIPNIVALKESSGDIQQIIEVINQTDDDFAVYSGDDHLTLSVMQAGGDGVVSVASHVFGNELKQMVDHHTQEIHDILLPFFEGIFISTNPVPMKYLLNKQGFSVGSVRLPLVEMGQMQKDQLDEITAATTMRFHQDTEKTSL